METSRAPNNRREAFIRRRDSEIRENMAGERGEITELKRLPHGTEFGLGLDLVRDVTSTHPSFSFFLLFFLFITARLLLILSRNDLIAVTACL